MTFPELVVRFRLFVNWKQADLAQKLNRSRTTISLWETGTVRPHPRAHDQLIDVMRQHGFKVQVKGRESRAS